MSDRWDVDLADFPQIRGEVYVDHAGTTLPSTKLMNACFSKLQSTLLGNPHSLNPSSLACSQEIEEARKSILEFFDTDADHYSVVFTTGATGACRLLGESFPWSTGSVFRHTLSNHNSVLGIRTVAAQHGAVLSCVDSIDVEEWLSGANRQVIATQHLPYNLFAFPATCNFSGTKYPLRWTEMPPRWLCFVDAACHAATAPLSLATTRPHFVAVSFYKIFGFPTGIGALIVRNDVAHLLHKSYFGGGTVAMSLADVDEVVPRPGVSARLEDGTQSFQSIVAVREGLRMMRGLGMDRVSQHVTSLAQRLRHAVQALKHFSGTPVCELYGPGPLRRTTNSTEYTQTDSAEVSDAAERAEQTRHVDESASGSIVTLNFLDQAGRYIGYSEIERLAALSKIHLRTGCFCNPGACHTYLRLTAADVRSHMKAGHVCWDRNDIIAGRPTGAVRFSFGYMSTVQDVDAVVSFVRTHVVQAAPAPSHQLADNGNQLQLVGITVFPVKSCSGFTVTEWRIGVKGLMFDREWVVVNDKGNFLNQKSVPRMTLIKTELSLARNTLTLHAPDVDPIDIPLDYVPGTASDVNVCGDRVEGRSYDSRVNGWLSSVLQRPCSLVRQSGERQAAGTGALSLANESQFLAVTQDSVVDLNARIAQRAEGAFKTIPVTRFRGNLIFQGAAPYAEDTWERLSVGEQIFRVVGPCSRCQMVCIDQETAERHAEPMVTLMQYRKSDLSEIKFGVHLAHEVDGSVGAILRCGPATVLSTKADAAVTGSSEG